MLSLDLNFESTCPLKQNLSIINLTWQKNYFDFRNFWIFDNNFRFNIFFNQSESGYHVKSYKSIREIKTITIIFIDSSIKLFKFAPFS